MVHQGFKGRKVDVEGRYLGHAGMWDGEGEVLCDPAGRVSLDRGGALKLRKLVYAVRKHDVREKEEIRISGQCFGAAPGHTRSGW